MKIFIKLFILIFLAIQAQVIAGNVSALPVVQAALQIERSQFYKDVANAIDDNKFEIVGALNEIGTIQGATYEVEQALKTLRGAPDKELMNFNSVQNLNKLAIYGSSNIPLYTMVLQIFIPSVVFDKIVFKVSSKTKNVYQKIWKILERSLSDRYLLSKKVEFVVSNQKGGSVDYMMDSILGKTQDRLPADMVVFTGNPQNGDQLVQQIKEKINELNLSNHKMLFMKFGAGMNPVIIDQSIQVSQLRQAVETSLEHFKINSGQDCISPNFSLLPISYKANAIEIIRNHAKDLHFGSLQNPKADYSLLTFGTQNSINALAEFKERYKEFLVTDKSALIDPISKRVDPHVYIFPSSMYKELSLNEFYAPFAIFFTYSSQEELAEMIQDPRLKKRAMFASLFGDPQSSSYKVSYRELTRTRHTVFPNASVFKEEDGNKPFGGFGADVSTVDILTTNASHTKHTRFVRPLLLSKEIRKEFSSSRYQRSTQPDTVLGEGSRKSPVITFGVEIELNVYMNPKIVNFYRPAYISEDKWSSLSEKEKIETAKTWESKIGKEYKVIAYEKLSSSPIIFPAQLLSESNGFYEMNGLIFTSYEELSSFTKTVKNTVGEGYMQAHIVFDRQHFKGYAGFYKFMSEYSIIQTLSKEQQRYFSSNGNPNFIPGSNFTSHSLPPPGEQHYQFVEQTEQSILKGEFQGFRNENEYLVYKHVSAPVVRSSQGYASTYTGDKIGIEVRMADSPSDSIMFGGRAEELLGYVKIIEQAVSNHGDLSFFLKYSGLNSYSSMNAKQVIRDFIHENSNLFHPTELKQINFDRFSINFGKNNLIDKLIRQQNPHIDYGPLDTSSRMLFPIKDWKKHAVLLGVSPKEKQDEVLNEYLKATKNYILQINQIMLQETQSSHSNILSKMRLALGEWSWGIGKKSYSEILTPWNLEMKLIKKGLGQSRETLLRSQCLNFYRVAP